MRRWFLPPTIPAGRLLAVLLFFQFVWTIDLRAQSDASVQIFADPYLPAAIQTAVSVVISNAGPAAVSSLRLTNDLPAGTEFLSSDGPAGCAVIGNSVVCDLDTIGAQNAITVTLNIRHNRVEDGLMRSTISVPTTDSNSGNNTTTRLLRFAPLLQGNDVSVTERPGGTNALFLLQFSAPSPTPTTISVTVTSVTATAGSDFVVPSATQISFAAGVTQQTFAVTVLDDAYFEGAESFQVSLSAASDVRVLIDRGNLLGVILDNDPPPTLSVSAPVSISEASGILSNQGVVKLSAPLDHDLVLTLTSSDTTELTVPSSVTIDATHTTATFDLRAIDDVVLDGPQIVKITATAQGFLSASTNITVTDNESAALTVIAPASFNEGSPPASNSVRVVSASTVTSNVIVQLSSSDTTQLTVPPQVVIPAGQTTAYFPVTVIDDTDTDGAQPVSISASANGFTGGNTTVIVNDNDVFRYVISQIPNRGVGVTSTIPFVVTISAHDVNDNVIPDYTGPTYLSALGDAGPVGFTPTNIVRITDPGWTGTITITNGANSNVRLIASDGRGHTGESNPFNVFAPTNQQLRITTVKVIGTNVAINFATVKARNYRVEAAPVLRSNQWITVISPIAGTGGVVSVTNFGGATLPQRFYRVQLQP